MFVKAKSTPFPVESVEQVIASLPVTAKVIAADDEVEDGAVNTTVGGVESIVTVPLDAADKLPTESTA